MHVHQHTTSFWTILAHQQPKFYSNKYIWKLDKQVLFNHSIILQGHGEVPQTPVVPYNITVNQYYMMPNTMMSNNYTMMPYGSTMMPYSTIMPSNGGDPYSDSSSGAIAGVTL